MCNMKWLATPYRLFHHRLLITVVILTNRPKLLPNAAAVVAVALLSTVPTSLVCFTGLTVSRCWVSLSSVCVYNIIHHTDVFILYMLRVCEFEHECAHSTTSFVAASKTALGFLHTNKHRVSNKSRHRSEWSIRVVSSSPAQLQQHQCPQSCLYIICGLFCLPSCVLFSDSSEINQCCVREKCIIWSSLKSR